ncbi:MAG: DNA gyrase/topoisomerase IV subunit A [Bacteroidetes bacterium]|nr:MAG: DNA gyrase/topoisomerase IV subunit A [Bacteroidota bacterium]
MDDSTNIPTQNGGSPNGNEADNIISLRGMYKDYFLDYASYVILERAVPSVEDGLKPVQRRILHAMKQMDDGRYHKVANIIGQTMQYHPHGDAAIGDALVNLGQKNLLIDCQGNWGDNRTGDRAAAPRYIEARLTKFALEVAFNPQTTEWQLTYDGRKKEPINLPMKFPLLLAQGADGIAVGLSTKILPHNFIELIKASIKILQGKKVHIYPDFDTGGLIDVSEYNGGKRGGRVKVRARIEKLDKNTLVIKDLPYGVTTVSLMESIVKANDKGKIKIKKVTDNTAAEVEILVELAPGISPDVTMDALYAFTDCEVSISPNACVIINDKPHFITVEEILDICTQNTKRLLKWELEIKKSELEEKWHFASLEKIFIENRIYHQIEECESWEAVIETIDRELKRYVATPSDPPKKGDKRLALMRDVTEEDIVRLTEIKIKRISKYNTFKADEKIAEIEAGLEEVKHHLANLTDFTIAYYENLLQKYGKGKERRTVITSFDTIQATQVVANNSKLYINAKEGFIGSGLKKDEFVCDCSDIDDIIVFLKDGRFKVVKMADKVFVGKDIIHAAVWKKGDERTTYNMIYVDGKSGRAMAKRFNVTAITRDRDYVLTKGTPGSKVLYFTANPNGEAETVTIQLTQGCKAKKKVFDFDFGELAIKGRGSQGNIVTRYPVRKITQKEVGQSTLGAIKLWMDNVSGRLNNEERGTYLGAFDTGDQILAIYSDGSYEITDYELTNRYDAKAVVWIGKYDPEAVINALYYDGNKKWSVVKRFKIETNKTDQRFGFIPEHRMSRLLFATTQPGTRVQYTTTVDKRKVTGTLDFDTFIDVKGWKALGNKLADGKVAKVKVIEGNKDAKDEKTTGKSKLKAGDTIDFDLDDTNGQAKLF